MSSEKQNKGWKDNLLDWESSGVQDASAGDPLWQKLQSRLQPAPIRRRIGWLRAAAAILVLLTGGFLLWQPASTGSHPGLSPRVKTGNALVQPAGQPEKEIKTGIPGPEALPTAAAPLKTVPAQIVTESQAPIPDPVVASLPVRDTSPVLANAPEKTMTAAELPVQKKKLKIVHMNEWNAPPPPAYAAQKDRQPEWITDGEDIPAGPSIWPGKNRNRTLSASRN